METKDTCLYIHTRKTDGGIFYVGIGNEKRPYTKTKRNYYWNNTVKKHGYDVTILKTNMGWKEACELEIKMIAFYGRIKPNPKNLNYGCLVNMTDGGDGANGHIHSKETREKISKGNTGKKASEETKQKMRKIMTGKYIGEKSSMFGKTHSEENKKKISERMRGNNHMFGKTHSEKTKKKMSERMRGENNHRFGKKASEETKKKMSEKRSGEKHPNAQKVICNITNKIYNCIKDAAEDIGVNVNTLRGYLCGHRPNKTSLRYL